MKTIDLYFDFISPYAYLAFEHAPQALQGCDYAMRYRPVLFAAMLQQHGQLGPAEIAPKRRWTYQQIQWQAKTLGVPLDMPASHPFNPLTLLRVAMSARQLDGYQSAVTATPNRYVCAQIFKHVWTGGLEATDAERLQALAQELGVSDYASAEVKLALKDNTQAAIDLNLFGVPTFVVDGQCFWGLDALPMLKAYLQGDAWFGTPAWQQADARPGLQRPR